MADDTGDRTDQGASGAEPDDPPPTGAVPSESVTGGRTVPLGRLLFRGATLACPACGARGHFRQWVRMSERCHRCGLKFERIEGHWIGAIGLNTIVSFGALLVFLVVAVALTIPDIPVGPLVLGNIVVALVVPVLFYPASRTLWTAVDIAMRPLEAHEVDWTEVGWTGSGR
ncbi:MAG: DUF983 domain-containing protein [Actinomycetota bacterium]